MSLAIGIVDLPNVDKSTTFNALTKAQDTQSANYPFYTIKPNRAMVEVPDERLKELAKIIRPEKILRSLIEFVDIAGLVKGAGKGEDLGNKLLSNIRETKVILHIVHYFDGEDITHVEGGVDPIRDIKTINAELILADIEQLSKEIEKLNKETRTSQKDTKESLELATSLLERLNKGFNASSYGGREGELYQNLIKELRLLSVKEVIYGANIDEEGINRDNQFALALKEYAKKNNREVIEFYTKIKEELVDLSGKGGAEFLGSLGVKGSGLTQIICTAFSGLGLVSYFTAGETEVRSWTIERGYRTPKATNVIHNDFEKGFIRAKVISYEDFIKSKGENDTKEAGKLRLEGKDYIICDGDVMRFRLNV